MASDTYKPKTLPFVKDCIYDNDPGGLIHGLAITIPSCEMPEVPVPKRLIPAGRPTMPITTPPPPTCLQPCPMPFSYEVVGPLTVRMRMDGLLDPTSYELWRTSSATATKMLPEDTVRTYLFGVPANAITFVYLVYSIAAGQPVAATGGSNMFHIGSEFPPSGGSSGGSVVPLYPPSRYSLLLLHRMDTRGISALSQVLHCPPGIQNPPYATTVNLPPQAARHPFQLFPTLPGCRIAIWPGIVMDGNGETWEPKLEGKVLTAVPDYTWKAVDSSKSFWLEVKYTTEAEVESVESVAILVEDYDKNYKSNYSTLYVLIGKVVYGGIDATTSECVTTPWNSLRTSIAISKCDARHTVVPLG